LVSSSEPEGSGFDSLGLSEPMLAALREAGYLEPTPVQSGLIPRALAGIDILGQARTGTGKTASFVIPILERIEHGKQPQALILVPTRELAVQVREELVKLAFGTKVTCVALYGGKPIRGQIDKLKRGVDVIVGTPGRVLDHMSRMTLVLDSLKFVVLDEADRMLDIGFRPDIEKILRKCPQSRQTLLLSATVPPPVERLSKRYMRDPETLNFSSGEVSVETIEQFYFTVTPQNKFELLSKLLKREDPRQAIVFCRTKRGTERVFQHLRKKFEECECIHGDLQQKVRDRVMLAFREGKVRILVATDVVGRGIDVSGISHIVNYDIPSFCDDYVHRVGRTGRMGREGVAYTFVTPEEGPELTRIEMRIERLLGRAEIEGFAAFAKPQGDPNLAKSGPQYDGDGQATDGDAPPDAPKKPTPVFGRPVRRIRRAL